MVSIRISLTSSLPFYKVDNVIVTFPMVTFLSEMKYLIFYFFVKSFVKECHNNKGDNIDIGYRSNMQLYALYEVYNQCYYLRREHYDRAGQTRTLRTTAPVTA